MEVGVAATLDPRVVSACAAEAAKGRPAKFPDCPNYLLYYATLRVALSAAFREPLAKIQLRVIPATTFSLDNNSILALVRRGVADGSPPFITLTQERFERNRFLLPPLWPSYVMVAWRAPPPTYAILSLGVLLPPPLLSLVGLLAALACARMLLRRLRSVRPSFALLHGLSSELLFGLLCSHITTEFARVRPRLVSQR
jgi:hypothetical protein